MRVAVMTFRLHASWVHSLKEKRMIVKSIIARLQNRFHVSAAEVDEQDTHQIIVLGVASIIRSSYYRANEFVSYGDQSSNPRYTPDLTAFNAARRVGTK